MTNKNLDKELNNEILSLVLIKCLNIIKSKKIIDIHASHEEREAFFIFLMVLINVLILEMQKYGFVFKNKYEDLQDFDNITDLLRYMRNACCHINSNKNYENEDMFRRFQEKLGNDGKYSNDATIYFGEKYVLYFRHIVFAFQEICNFLDFPFNLEDALLS